MAAGQNDGSLVGEGSCTSGALMGACGIVSLASALTRAGSSVDGVASNGTLCFGGDGLRGRTSFSVVHTDVSLTFTFLLLCSGMGKQRPVIGDGLRERMGLCGVRNGMSSSDGWSGYTSGACGNSNKFLSCRTCHLLITLLS